MLLTSAALGAQRESRPERPAGALIQLAPAALALPCPNPANTPCHGSVAGAGPLHGSTARRRLLSPPETLTDQCYTFTTVIVPEGDGGIPELNGWTGQGQVGG